uniref:NADH-quinone oxidoreductase subunit H n=1 Tax=Lygus hesperus TaxID=30085 RepID=A0A0A9YPQ4_LYGHE
MCVSVYVLIVKVTRLLCTMTCIALKPVKHVVLALTECLTCIIRRQRCLTRYDQLLHMSYKAFMPLSLHMVRPVVAKPIQWKDCRTRQSPQRQQNQQIHLWDKTLIRSAVVQLRRMCRAHQ